VASAWGESWGKAFGNAWGALKAPDTDEDDSGYLVVGHRPARPLDPPKRTKTKQQRQNEQILMLLLQ